MHPVSVQRQIDSIYRQQSRRVFARAVQATEDETVAFSWIEWPDKATRDAAMKAIEANAEIMARPMPFDGKRMIFGGFITVYDAKAR